MKEKYFTCYICGCDVLIQYESYEEPPNENDVYCEECEDGDSNLAAPIIEDSKH